MLLGFQVTNFRSFRERHALSMVAGSYSEHLGTNTAEMPGVGRVLRSAVIYGPNAAGKTSVLRALEFMKLAVLNSASTKWTIPYSPFKLAASTREAPSEFEVSFINEGVKYEYGFAVDGERVVYEWLRAYIRAKARELFSRRYNKKTKESDWKFSIHFKGQRAVWKKSTRENALFLSTAVQLNSAQLAPIFRWFQSRLHIIVGITQLNITLTLKLLGGPEGATHLLPFMRAADPGIAGIDVEREPVPAGANVIYGPSQILEQKPDGSHDLIKVTMSRVAEDNKTIGFDFGEESSGTRVLFRTAGAWINVLKNGEVLLFDEIDTSLHLNLAEWLIKNFHSNTANKLNAQLIATTHNVGLMDTDVFRRDQLWFVEKKADNSSELYPLSDFHARNEQNLGKNYLAGKYGALPILDPVRK